MSEKLHAPITPEKNTRLASETDKRSQEIEKRLEKASEKAQRSAENLAEIRSEVAQESQAAAPSQEQARDGDSGEPVFMTRELKQQSFRQTIDRVQKKLPKAEATFSKFLHNNVVDKLSQTASETVGRPSVITGGAVFSGVGCLMLAILARRGGFSLSGYEFLILLIVGMLIGFLAEVLARLFKKRF